MSRPNDDCKVAKRFQDDGQGSHAMICSKHAANRDRGSPRGLPPPTPPGIRVRTTAVRLVKLSWQVVPEAAGRPVPPTPCRARRNSRLENGCCASCLDGYQRFVQQDPCRHPTSATL